MQLRTRPAARRTRFTPYDFATGDNVQLVMQQVVDEINGISAGTAVSPFSVVLRKPGGNVTEYDGNFTGLESAIGDTSDPCEIDLQSLTIVCPDETSLMCLVGNVTVRGDGYDLCELRGNVSGTNLAFRFGPGFKARGVFFNNVALGEGDGGPAGHPLCIGSSTGTFTDEPWQISYCKTYAHAGFYVAGYQDVRVNIDHCKLLGKIYCITANCSLLIVSRSELLADVDFAGSYAAAMGSDGVHPGASYFLECVMNAEEFEINSVALSSVCYRDCRRPDGSPIRTETEDGGNITDLDAASGDDAFPLTTDVSAGNHVILDLAGIGLSSGNGTPGQVLTLLPDGNLGANYGNVTITPVEGNGTIDGNLSFRGNRSIGGVNRVGVNCEPATTCLQQWHFGTDINLVLRNDAVMAFMNDALDTLVAGNLYGLSLTFGFGDGTSVVTLDGTNANFGNNTLTNVQQLTVGTDTPLAGTRFDFRAINVDVHFTMDAASGYVRFVKDDGSLTTGGVSGSRVVIATGDGSKTFIVDENGNGSLDNGYLKDLTVPAPDGTYALPTSITIENGKITAIS